MKEADVPHHDEAPRWYECLVAGGRRVRSRAGFRVNVLLDTGEALELVEDVWVGWWIRIGEVELEVLRKAVRCVMVGLPADGLPAAPELLKTISDDQRPDASVSRPGSSAAGRSASATSTKWDVPRLTVSREFTPAGACLMP